jgi:isoleucyl-tRNA synthetase
MADSYRRIRNTLRFLLGNLAGFDPASDAVAPQKWVALDAWIVARAAKLQGEIIAAYRDYDFHQIYQKVHNFCVVDLGSLYLDVIKDRLYTTPRASLARRSAQTASWHLAESMVRWLAPILSFTAEEVWRHMPGKRSASVFLEQWVALPQAAGDSSLDWDFLLAVRAEVARELERLRVAGAIGSSLGAAIDIYVRPELAPKLQALGDELRFLLITSAARVHVVTSEPDATAQATAVAGLWVKAAAIDAPKCARCWHLREDVGSHTQHPLICGRCVSNVEGPGETRRYA